MKPKTINPIFYLKIVIILLASYALIFSSNHEKANTFDVISISCLTICIIYAGVYVIVSLGSTIKNILNKQSNE